MARVFITGSTDGLGRMAAELLIDQGHQVVLHARNSKRAQDPAAGLPGREGIVIGDLSSIATTRAVAEEVNRRGKFDAVIHNAAVGYREPKRVETEDGLPEVFAVNTLAPYILTALIGKPKRLVYLRSGVHRGADASLDDLAWTERRWHGTDALPRANCTTCYWRLPWQGGGRMYSPTHSSRAGYLQKWGGHLRPTIWIWRIAHKPGSRSATTRRVRS